MTFLRFGYPVMALTGACAVVVLAVSVWRRNWSLWLLGFALFALAIGVAFASRVPVPAAAARS
jgi:hypothetical protein